MKTGLVWGGLGKRDPRPGVSRDIVTLILLDECILWRHNCIVTSHELHTAAIQHFVKKMHNSCYLLARLMPNVINWIEYGWEKVSQVISVWDRDFPTRHQCIQGSPEGSPGICTDDSSGNLYPTQKRHGILLIQSDNGLWPWMLTLTANRSRYNTGNTVHIDEPDFYAHLIFTYS